MAKAKVEITGAYVDGHGPGSTIEVDQKTAEYLERLGYGKIVVEAESSKKQTETKVEAEAEEEAKPKRTRKKKDD